MATKQEAEIYAESIAVQRGIVRKGKVRITPTYSARIGEERSVWTVEKFQLCFTRPGDVYFQDDLTPDHVEAKLTLRNPENGVVMKTTVLLDFLMRGPK